MTILFLLTVIFIILVPNGVTPQGGTWGVPLSSTPLALLLYDSIPVFQDNVATIPLWLTVFDHSFPGTYLLSTWIKMIIHSLFMILFYLWFHLWFCTRCIQRASTRSCSNNHFGIAQHLLRCSVLHLPPFQGDILQSLLSCNKHFRPEGMFGTQPQCEIAVTGKVYIQSKQVVTCFKD